MLGDRSLAKGDGSRRSLLGDPQLIGKVVTNVRGIKNDEISL